MGTFSRLREQNPAPWYRMKVDISTGQTGIPKLMTEEFMSPGLVDVLCLYPEPVLYVRAKTKRGAEVRGQKQMRAYLMVHKELKDEKAEVA